MKKLLILLCFGLILAGQPITHVVGGKIAWNMTDKFCNDMNYPGLKPVLKPVAAMLSHVIIDRFVGEAYLGDYQVDIGLVRVVIGYFLQNENNRQDYVEYAVWSLVPDVIDKLFGTQFFHLKNNQTIFNLDRNQTELLEELSLASIIFKWEF